MVKDEITSGKDTLTDWINDIEIFDIGSRKDVSVVAAYAKVINFLNESPLYTMRAVHSWSNNKVADPWLIAYAETYGHTIITFESSAGKIGNASNKPKIPDIAKQFGVKTENLFYLMRQMSFSL